MTTKIVRRASNCASSHIATYPTGEAASGTSDSDLVRRIAAADKLAMQALYARHSVRAFRFAARILGNVTSAEDVVSDVFLDVWRKAKNFEGQSEVSTWLLAITRHKALEEARRRRPEQLDDKSAEILEDLSDNPEVAASREETGSILRKCLTQLSPAHSEIINLVYYHGRSIDDIAAITGIARSTVKTRMFYARKHLADLLRAEGVTTHAS